MISNHICTHLPRSLRVLLDGVHVIYLVRMTSADRRVVLFVLFLLKSFFPSAAAAFCEFLLIINVQHQTAESDLKTPKQNIINWSTDQELCS